LCENYDNMIAKLDFPHKQHFAAINN